MLPFHNKLIVKCPRNTNLKHTRIERITRNLERLAITEEVVVKVLIFQQDTHTLPLSSNKGIDIRIVTNLYLILIIEDRECWVISAGIILCIKSTIQTDLHA